MIIFFRISLFLHLLVLINFGLSAHVENPCHAPLQNEKVNQAEKFLFQLKEKVEDQWFSAIDQDVLNKKCAVSVPSISEIESFNNLKSSESPSKSVNSYGIMFENESPALVRALEDLLMKKDVFGANPEGVNLQKKFKVNPECKKVKCAVEKIFGKEVGNKILYLKTKFGFNSSEFAFDESSRLNSSELDSLIAAASSYPENRFPINSNKQLTHYARNKTDPAHADGGVYAYAAIAFYDLWSKQSHEDRELTAFHEMAHFLGSELNLDETKKWRDLGGWVEVGTENGKTVWNGNTKLTASDYGATNPDEDFAEALVAYRYRPDYLKRISPEKYDFIKNTVFDGLEYTSEEKCQSNRSFSQKLKVQAKISTDMLSKKDFEEVIKKCARPLNDYVVNRPNSKEEFNYCMANYKYLKGMREAVDRLNPPPQNKAQIKSSIPSLSMEDFKKLDTGKILANEKKYLKDQLIKGLLDWDKFNEFNYSPTNTAQKQCNETWDKYSRQAAFSDNNFLKNTILGYQRADEYQDRFKNICLKIQSKKPKPTPFTKAELEIAIDF